MIEEYLKLTNNYGERTLPAVKATLIQFFGFVCSEGIDRLEDIDRGVVTRFMAWERERGLTRGNYITRVKALFDWLDFEGRTTMRNPVMPRHHYEKNSPDQPRPYSDEDLASIWNLVEEGESVMLKLAFVIGKECGLRIGEVCNIRVSDVNREKQTIHVRLPTKNMRTRDVRYHDDVAKYLDLWLSAPRPLCGEDHLLCGEFGAVLNTNTLIAKFKKLLGEESSPADTFKFHRLRHTWATRLMNNGMELAVLKELGGWVSWNSMQRYIRVLPETVQRQYQEAYAKIQLKQESDPEETMSLLDFALMDDDRQVTYAESAV
jgi:integrase